MNEWFQRQLANGFRDLPGLHIAGTIPLRDQFLNELIGEALQGAANAAPAAPKQGQDLRPLLQLVRRLQVRAHEGQVVVDFEIGNNS